jgi:hypothetical protein
MTQVQGRSSIYQSRRSFVRVLQIFLSGFNLNSCNNLSWNLSITISARFGALHHGPRIMKPASIFGFSFLIHEDLSPAQFAQPCMIRVEHHILWIGFPGISTPIFWEPRKSQSPLDLGKWRIEWGLRSQNLRERTECSEGKSSTAKALESKPFPRDIQDKLRSIRHWEAMREIVVLGEDNK